ncbi:hypothetical protein [Gilvibacter sediminis]|uniref:hypothetical protein n=1 Tax=Gilvibacter sediminis TaxID=379071 RepID=UPI00234FD7C7|nr:hypothetical protein [Gilvibacter sediminis]MDC7998298.1 hypothetical protein [Gilvibacter sediminis]
MSVYNSRWILINLAAVLAVQFCQAQEYSTHYEKRIKGLEIGINTGYCWLKLEPGQALRLTTNDLTQNEITVNEQAAGFNQEFDGSAAQIGLFANWNFSKQFSLGIQWDYLQQIEYRESAFITQSYFDSRGQLSVHSSGRYAFGSTADINVLWLGFKWSPVTFDIRNNRLSLFLKAGGGSSFFKLVNRIPDAFLSLDFVSPAANGNFRLGPGEIVKQEFNQQAWAWQLGGGLSLRSKHIPGISLGFYYTNLGSFIQQDVSPAELFVLDAVNSQAEDQFINISSSQQPRSLKSLSLALQIFVW